MMAVLIVCRFPVYTMRQGHNSVKQLELKLACFGTFLPDQAETLDDCFTSATPRLAVIQGN